MSFARLRRSFCIAVFVCLVGSLCGNIPSALAKLKGIGDPCKMMDTSFFLARQTLLASSRPGMAIWREKLFAWMLRNAESAMEFFKLPPNRVVELGSQVEI